MSAVKQKIESIMAAIDELISLKDNNYNLPLKVLRRAIILTIGADSRTINKYIALMLELGYIQRGINQYVFTVPQRRLDDAK